MLSYYSRNRAVGQGLGPGVDYKLVRKALFLLELSWKPHRLLDEWYNRHDWFTEMMPAYDKYRRTHQS